MINRVEKVCKTCGKHFMVLAGNALRGGGQYCSHKCVPRMKPHKIICEYCSEEFNSSPSHNRKYCSAECATKFRAERLLSRPKTVKPTIVRQCLVCDSSFETLEHNPKTYCSADCRWIARKKTRVIKNCLRCGKEFESLPSENREYCSHECKHVRAQITCPICQALFDPNGQQKCCSMECAQIARRGKNNYAWKGGRSPFRGRNWHAQRNAARRRDGDICQVCHKKRRKRQYRFDIHHIIPFREFDGDYISANDLNNLITLCKLCHKRVERGLIAVPLPLI